MNALETGLATIPRDLRSGIMLIAGSLAGMVVLSLHPTGHEMMRAGNHAHMAWLGTTIHGLAIAAVPVLFLGFLGLARRLGRSDLATAALVVYGFGGVAVISAAVASGFVATTLIGQMLRAEGEGRELPHALLAYTGMWNQAFAKVHQVATSVAFLLWSGAFLTSRRMSSAAAVVGAVIGAGVLLGLLSGHLRLDVHGFGVVTFAQSAWQIWLGILLCREVRASGPT